MTKEPPRTTTTITRKSTLRTRTAIAGISCLIQISTALVPPASVTLQRRTIEQETICKASTVEKETILIDSETSEDDVGELYLSWANLLQRNAGDELHHNGKRSNFEHSMMEVSIDSILHGAAIPLKGHAVHGHLSNGHSRNGHAVPSRLSPTMIGEFPRYSPVEDAIATAVAAATSADPDPSPWKRRYARTIQEGIRRECTTTQLDSLLSAKHKQLPSKRNYGARIITGLLNGLAEEADGLEVEVTTRADTPLWSKQVDSIQIRFNRLGMRPLRMGGLNDTLLDMVPSLAHVSSADEAFRRIDVDDSGALDGDEIALALTLAASTDSDTELIQTLSSQLMDLYDLNGDGVIDRDEYQLMVEDMAALRRIQNDRERQRNAEQHPTLNKRIWSLVRNPIQTLLGRHKMSEIVNETIALSSDAESEIPVEDSPPLIDAPPKGSGTMTFSNLKLDLRQLAFGAIPLIKRITPGGPLILEPFTATLIGSFNKDDVMESSMLDAGLRRLVARALRRRVRSFRDLVDGAVFYGRDWNMASQRAPQVEVAKLTSVEFDDQDRMVITGRVRIRTSPEAPEIENAFKVRTKIGTRKDGHIIRLVEPELALVVECPKGWEHNIVTLCKRMNLPVPVRPEPLYAFFPIYSPFKVEDNDGFDMGEDNCLKSIYIKDGALRLEMSCVLRPGRFLGNHYIAFSFPNRNFVITLDRVRAGIRDARKNKREAAKRKGELYQASMAQSLSKHPQWPSSSKDEFTFIDPNAVLQKKRALNKPSKSFFSRFVEGYLGVTKEAEVRNQRLTMAVSDWFGRQGSNTTVVEQEDDASVTKEST
jgi:hypothetical protein